MLTYLANNKNKEVFNSLEELEVKELFLRHLSFPRIPELFNLPRHISNLYICTLIFTTFVLTFISSLCDL